MSVSHRDKAPLTGWLRTTDIYSLSVLEAGGLRSRCWQGRGPTEAEAGQGGPFSVGLTLHSAPSSSSSVCVSLGRAPTQMTHNDHLISGTLIKSAEIFLPNKGLM